MPVPSCERLQAPRVPQMGIATSKTGDWFLSRNDLIDSTAAWTIDLFCANLSVCR
jgi:hypothetical protein